MTRLTLATRAPGPLAKLTGERHGLTLEAYPLGDSILIRAQGDIERLAPTDWGVSTREVARAKGTVTVLLARNPDADVADVLAARGARLVPPIVWSRGEARVELDLSPSADPRTLLALFPAARLIAKRAMGDARLADPLPGLTAKQAAAISLAYEMGYYESPKKVTTGQVAKRFGAARSTLEGHLSRAEKALIGAMLPVARARHDPAASAAALGVFSAYSDAIGAFVRMEIVGDAVRRVDLLSRSEPTPASHPYLESVLEHVRTGKGDLADVPVALELSGFDKRVLDALRRIPPGRTVTYGELARKLGKPRAARAVGNACAKNPVLVVIPCHRVVPAAGGVGNYAGAGGARTKEFLLAREKANAGKRVAGS